MTDHNIDPLDINSLLERCPLGQLDEEIERDIASSLPVISGLVPGLSNEERIEILTNAASTSRAAFIALYGDPFGSAQIAGPVLAPHADPRSLAIV